MARQQTASPVGDPQFTCLHLAPPLASRDNLCDPLPVSAAAARVYVMNTLTPEMTGLLGATLGSVIGVSGGLLGTWMALRNVACTAQQIFLTKAAVLCWPGVLAFTATTLLVSAPASWLLWIVYGPLLLWFIRYVNHTLAALNASQDVEESAE
ncbi:MAG: hypothetical protein VX346_11195 [Planctomycetota bacterium]|nr:hypothetical protein [Planctomycetota bacterium]